MTRRYSTALGIALAVVVADLVTKRYAAIHFDGSPVEVIPGFLTLTFTENPGAAFSLFPNAGPFLGVAAIVVSVFVLWSIRSERPLLELIALALVLGGAVGNLMNRVFRGEGFLDGHVIDWIAMWWIPTFNIADASVTTAVGLLFIYSWRTR